MSNRTKRKRELSIAQERYVECISEAESEHGHAHISLMAHSLGVAKPSVVQMASRLEKKGIVKRKEKEVTLTQLGQRIAAELNGRHAILQEFMEKCLGMDPKAADQEACRLEHVVSPRFMRGVQTSVSNIA